MFSRTPFLLASSFVLIACAGAYAGDSPKPVTVQESFYVAPASLEALWDNSVLIAKVVVERSAPTLQHNQVLTRHTARVVRTLKGTIAPGAKIEFLQSGGTVETADRIIRASDAPLMQVGSSYYVFLMSLPQFDALYLTHNHFGAFEVRQSRIVPLGNSGTVADEHRDLAESRFADELERMRVRRGGGMPK